MITFILFCFEILLETFDPYQMYLRFMQYIIIVHFK